MATNATNFVGAYNLLNANFASENGFRWKFIPPHSLNFVGLWEATIKSAKYLVSRCLHGSLGDTEQYMTFFNQIETILNLRPLCSKCTRQDVATITPAHFLVGDSLLALPENYNEPSEMSIPPVEQLLKSFRNRIVSFWVFWHNDYLAPTSKLK